MAGIVNSSSKEKTVNNMFALLDNDNYTIDKTLLYCDYNETGFQIEFSNIMNNYRDYFEQYLEEMEVPERFFYQPAAFSENYYGTPDLDFVVLYFAKMKSLFEFTKKKIKVLPKSRLLELNRLFIEYKEEVKDSYENPTPFVEDTILQTYTKK